jgi:hypothetical protein
MFIGEPEIDLNKQPGGKLTVEIKGICCFSRNVA